MKIFYFFLIFAFFSCELFAEEDVNLGIIRQIISKNSTQISAQESDSFTPKLDNILVYDVSFNDEYQSTNRQNEFKETRSRGRLNSSFNFAKHLSFNAFLRFSQSNQASENSRRSALPTGGGDRTFENEGLFIEELNFTYEGKKHALVLGKFNPNFGSAWRFNRGIWAYEIAEDYRQREKLGLNGIYRIGDSKKNGRYEFGYAFFTNDRKNFDNSTITGRDSAHKSDANVGDTRSLSSYVGSLDIDFDFAPKERLTYHFAYQNLAVNNRASSVAPAKIADQKAWVAGMNYRYPIKDFLVLDGLLEYAKVQNLGGNSDVQEDYFTGNLIARFISNWRVTLAYAKHHNAVLAGDSYDKNLSEISFGYEFGKNSFFDRLILQAGYKNQRDNYKTSLESRNSLGALLRYQKGF
jgi:hypothetical protein